MVYGVIAPVNKKVAPYESLGGGKPREEEEF
jgi:hypothetical protein